MQHILSDEELNELHRRAGQRATLEADRDRRLDAVEMLNRELQECGAYDALAQSGKAAFVAEKMARLRKEICQ